MEIKPTFLQKHPLVKDLLSLALFIGCVIIGTVTLNAFVFRSYNVVGSSMENTLNGDDRVIVNRLPVTWDHFWGREYVPSRGEVIVFANGASDGPLTCEAPAGVRDLYVIMRVVAFPGERVTVKDGVMTVYTEENPDGYQPDFEWRQSAVDGPKEYTSGEVDVVVPEGELFVAGDNREGAHSYDSRNGLGTVPYCRVIGPAVLRIFPFTEMKFL